MKHQVLFSLKNNEKNLRMSSAAVALRVKIINIIVHVVFSAVLRPQDANGKANSEDPDRTVCANLSVQILRILTIATSNNFSYHYFWICML